ncbi:MAG: HAD family hydrolase [Balneolaceae bacterium]|nr:MAG: HAD family hydrolase [Balneolaceae bacterium]
MKPILLFDIDGTLMHVKRAFTRNLIAEILLDFGIESNPLEDGSYSFAGRTDREIFTHLTSGSVNSAKVYDEVRKKYLCYMKQNFSPNDTERIGGATELVNYGKRENLEMGLCTGNYRESAYYKVNAAGYKDTFHFGGFGCNHADRKYIPGEALNDFKQLKGHTPPPERFVVIGDTPNDVRCAKHFGAVSVAVTTGSFDAGQLRESRPDFLLTDLRELIDDLPNL